MTASAETKKEIERRRTFAIISHPDAGKTTLTEKLLLYGGAINTAGSVKGKANAKYAVSDWMEIEKERGISVTSSVLPFDYKGLRINILDTPGHQDFSEDTYRTLMAADAAVMVIDASKGVESQTIKLFKVCVRRRIPIFTFINKMDRDAKDSFELLDDIETVLGIRTCPVNWPIGSGKEFKGIYDRKSRTIRTFTSVSSGGAKSALETDFKLVDGTVIDNADGTVIDNADDRLKTAVPDDMRKTLNDEIELLDGASDPLDLDLVREGKLSPVFFGSALTNFGVETFLDYFCRMSPAPLARLSDAGTIDPTENDFSAFVFKIQANMNKSHRDRIAFFRICSGCFDAEKEVFHVQSQKKLKLSQPQQIMAQDRKVIDRAYAGDVIGVFDPGIFSIGDTVIATGQKPFAYEKIPTFAPEHFCRVVQLNSMKRKQFVKGITQIAQEGAVQIFKDYALGMSEIVAGVVGVLQFDVLKYRLENEYGCEIRLEMLPYEFIRTVEDKKTDPTKLKRLNNVKAVKDDRENLYLLFVNDWMIRMVLEENQGLKLCEFT